MKRATQILLSFVLIGILAFSLYSCKDEETAPLPTVSIFSSVDGYQVAFTATVTDATSFAWDFDDDETSTEQNPVHTYALSGTYSVTLTVTGAGGTADATESVTISASEIEMLTGGVAMPDGKAWKFSPSAGEGDGIYYADAEMSNQEPLPAGILGLIGIASEYDDEFTFKHDGSYSHDVMNDSVPADAIYAILNGIPLRPTAEDVVVLVPFTPEAATFTYTEDTDLTLTVVPDDDNPETTEDITWSDVTVLEIAGGTEFLGILDATRKYVIFDIGVDKLQIGIFITAIDGGAAVGTPSHFLKMTLIPAD